MSKAILVMDMPYRCVDCLMSGYSNQGRPFCKAKRLHLDSFMCKPDWCPLVEFPEYSVRDYPEYDRYITGYDDGWDDCLNEILGE